MLVAVTPTSVACSVVFAHCFAAGVPLALPVAADEVDWATAWLSHDPERVLACKKNSRGYVGQRQS